MTSNIFSGCSCLAPGGDDFMFWRFPLEGVSQGRSLYHQISSWALGASQTTRFGGSENVNHPKTLFRHSTQLRSARPCKNVLEHSTNHICERIYLYLLSFRKPKRCPKHPQSQGVAIQETATRKALKTNKKLVDCLPEHGKRCNQCST